MEDAAGSRALVLVREAEAPAPAGPRPQAPFLAQLYACEAHLEGFRRHRRAGPGRASACYEASEHAGDGAAAHFQRVL